MNENSRHGDSLQTVEKFATLEDSFLAHIYHSLPVVLDRAKGATVWDVDGNSYIDFLACFGVVNQGHCHPKIIDALVAQSQKLTLTSRAFYNSQLPPYAAFVKEVFGYDKMLPMNTGAEAVETALKIARRWAYVKKGIPEGEAVILSADGCYHGRTLATTSLNTSTEYRRGFGPFMPGIGPITPSGRRVRFNHIEDLEAAFEESGDVVAAFLTEPVQGNGGGTPAEKGYLKAAYDLCKKHNALFIDDEVLAGCGRTGTLLSIEQDDVRPDIVILGKAVSGGVYPVSLVLADDRVMNVMDLGSHGSTFGGNPLACAVSTAAIKVILDENLAGRAKHLGQILLDGLRALQSPLVSQVRGRGLMVGLILDAEKLNGRTSWDLCLLLRSKGLLVRSSGPTTLRLLPPLAIPESDLLKAIRIIGEGLKELVVLEHIPGTELAREREFLPGGM